MVAKMAGASINNAKREAEISTRIQKRKINKE
jgi:hypothetical protein